MPWTPVIARSSETSGYWGTQTREPGTDEVVQPAGQPSTWGVTFRYARTTPTGTREDDCTFSLKIAKAVGGNIFSVGLDSELSTVETSLNAFATALATWMNDKMTLAEYIWHRHDVDNPPAEGGGEKTGPAIRRTPKAIVGVNANSRNTDQVASTITWQTASRKHWGRIYVPGITTLAVAPLTGRLTTTAADALALAARTLVNSLNSAGFELGVWTYKHQAFMPVYKLAVDDVMDIQRRRRPKQRAYQKLYTS